MICDVEIFTDYTPHTTIKLIANEFSLFYPGNFLSVTIIYRYVEISLIPSDNYNFMRKRNFIAEIMMPNLIKISQTLTILLLAYLRV